MRETHLLLNIDLGIYQVKVKKEKMNWKLNWMEDEKKNENDSLNQKRHMEYQLKKNHCQTKKGSKIRKKKNMIVNVDFSK